MRYIGPVTTFFPLDTRNFRQLITQWHSSNEDRRKDRSEKFRAYTPKIGSSFTIPLNSGKKTGFQERKRNTRETGVVTDQAENIPASERSRSSSNIWFSDPRKQAEVEYKFHLYSKLLKVVSKCQEKYRKPINRNDLLLVKSYGKSYRTDKTIGWQQQGLGLCTFISRTNVEKHTLTNINPGKSFNYKKVKVDSKTRSELSDTDKGFLGSLGISGN